MKVLAIGDVVGDIGLKALLGELPGLRERFQPDMLIVNAENAAGGVGTSAKQARRLLDSGVDVLTGGNHTLHDRTLFPVLESDPRVLRPANMARKAPGRGSCTVDVAGGYRVAVINLMGLVFIGQTAVSPFEVVDDLIERARRETDLVIVDIHAEATSEKVALAHYLDGRASLVFGTHTHVQTADARILTGGTAYVTDLGMTGPHDSVIGVRSEIIIKRFLTGQSGRFETADGGVLVQGAFVETGDNGHATHIETFSVVPSAQKDPPGW